MKAKILVLICIIALAGATNGFAQLNDVIRVNIPFQFTVGTAVLPAGVYDFSKNKMDTAIYVRSAKKDGPGSDALVMNRSREISAPHRSNMWCLTKSERHIPFQSFGCLAPMGI